MNTENPYPKYPYILEPQPEGGFLVRFVDLPEAFTEGLTEEEAAYNASEVLALALEQRLADGEPIPAPSQIDTGYRVAPKSDRMPPIHPGEILREELDTLDVSPRQLADALGVPAELVADVLNGQEPITPDLAQRLAGYCGTSPGLWLDLQIGYDRHRSKKMANYWRVSDVRVIEDYALRVRFLDGLEGVVRFQPSFFRGAFSHLVDPVMFRQVTVVDGAVTWPGELDLAPDAMHHEIKEHGGEWVVGG